MKRKYSRRHRAMRWLLILVIVIAMLQMCSVINSAPWIKGYFILCGRVTDREVTGLEFQVTYGDWGTWNESYGTKIEGDVFTVDEFVEWNGERLFLTLFETPESHRIAKVLMVSPERQVILDN